MPDKKPNIHEGHRKRMREEIVEHKNYESLPDHRLLEVLLFYGIPRKDTNPIAHELINRFGSLTNVMDAELEDLYSVPGMTQNAATLIKTVMPIARRYQEGKFAKNDFFENIDAIGDYLIKKYMGRKNETFAIICLDAKGKLKRFEMLNDGTEDMVDITWREIASVVLKHNASYVIISHNHTSGNALPSESDIQMTISLRSSLTQLGTRLLDHIIVAGNDYISMRQSAEFAEIFK